MNGFHSKIMRNKVISFFISALVGVSFLSNTMMVFEKETSNNLTVFAVSAMKTSTEGINLIKYYEKCRLKAYKATSDEEYYTIGWGHYGPDVSANMQITQEEADKMFLEDLVKYENNVNSFLNKNNVVVTQNQFDALVSFTYNCGNVWVSEPTFRLKTYLINGVDNYSSEEITIAFTNWNKQNGKVLAGLTKRRKSEAELFLRSKPNPSCSCSDSYSGTYTTKNVSTNLNIRDENAHSLSGGIVGKIPAGATFTVSKANGSIAHVNYNGTTGVVSMDFIEIATPAGHAPEGWLDVAEGGAGCVTVSGWALDRDDPNAAIEIHIYMDGPAGVGVGVAGGIIANESRPDVNEATGIGGNHGFTATIPLTVTGKHTFYAHAINIGPEGVNPVLPDARETEILAANKITAVKAENITSDGYTLSITVSNSSGIERVAVPVWTETNSQDDLNLQWQTVCLAKKTGDNTYTYQVKVSDHKNEAGKYCNDVYLFNGNTILDRWSHETGHRTYVDVPVKPVITTVVTTVTKPVTTVPNETTVTKKVTTKPVTTVPAETTVVPVTTTVIETTVPLVTTEVTTVTRTPLPMEINLENGEQYQIPVGSSDDVSAFKSNNPDVAVVSPSGVISAVGEGKATISVVYKDGYVHQIRVTAERPVILGDINDDGNVDVTDLTILAIKLVNNQEFESPKSRIAADVTQDGNIDLADLAMIRQFLSKKITRF